MGEKKSSKWYNDIMIGTGIDMYNKGIYATRNYILYRMMHYNNIKSNNILELAAGGVHLAQLILSKIEYIKSYVLSDFAPVILDEAKKINIEKFKVQNIDCENVESIDFSKFDTIICNSFEHIDNDIGLIKKMLPCTLFYFCTCNFDCHSHIRIFKNIAEIYYYYEKFLDIKIIHIYDIDEKTKKFIICSIKK